MTASPPKLLSRDVHAILREAWAAPLKSRGWTRSRLSTSAWSHRCTEGDSVSFWVQIDKYGWWDGFGSELTIEFQYDAGEPSSLPGSFDDRCRYKRLLDDDAIAAVLAANAGVRAGLPPDPPVAVPGFDPYPKDLDPPDSPDLARRSDLWLRYHHPEHVRWIAELLLPRFDDIATRIRERRRNALTIVA